MSDVTVVIPARNAAATLQEALVSVLDAPEVGEAIVIDDGSTDGTADVALSLGDPRVRVLPGPCRGIAGALNVGFEAASLPFLARCDADDRFPPGRVRWQRDWLAQHPDFIAVSGGFASILPDGFQLSELACSGDPREVTQTLLSGTPVTHLCSWLVRTDAVRRVGGARVWFRMGEDLDLQFRLAEVGRVWHSPKVAYHYRLHDGSITHESASATVAFYERKAKDFAAERRQFGTDSLQNGTPPPPPRPDGSKRQRTSAVGQGVGHATGNAWKMFHDGKKGVALGRVVSLLVRQPLSGQLWRCLILMGIKFPFRAAFEKRTR